jgi:hypothetical protein
MSSLLNRTLSFDDFTDRFIWEEIGLIDIRYCRGVPRNWEKGYKHIFSELNQFLKSRQQQGLQIKVSPSFQTLEWVLDKVAYTEELQRKGILTLPIIAVPPPNYSEHSSVKLDIVDHINRADVERIVLKPATGSGANNLEFITKTMGAASKYEVEFYQMDSNNSGKKSTLFLQGEQELYEHFKNYRSSLKQVVIVQDYVKTVAEISAVYINGVPHFVERLTGEDSRVAHERFGGKNTLILDPPQSWRSFAQNVYQTLPATVKNTISIRIDIFQCSDGKLLLSEIEGASQRLFFPETLEYFKKNPHTKSKKIEDFDLLPSDPFKSYIEALCTWHNKQLTGR